MLKHRYLEEHLVTFTIGMVFNHQVLHLLKLLSLKIQHIVGQGIARQYNTTLALGNRLKKGTLTTDYLKRNKSEIPYIGRLFIKNPIGWNSLSVKRLVKNKDEREKVLDQQWADILEKYGEEFEGTKEFNAYLIQYVAWENLESGYKIIEKFNEEIRAEQKKEKPDWILIEEKKSEMTKIASDCLLGVDLPQTIE